MQGSMALADGMLALVCLTCAIVIGKARKGYAEPDQPALFCALLGFLLAAAAASVGAMQHAVAPGWLAAYLWLSQASSFLGLPLLGVAALTLGRGWACSRPNWGRIVLGLCAFFELFRQMNLLDDYRLGLNLATLLLLVYAGVSQWPRRTPACAALAVVGLFLLTDLAVGSDGYIGLDLSHALLTAAYPLLAWLLLNLPGNADDCANRENPVKTL